MNEKVFKSQKLSWERSSSFLAKGFMITMQMPLSGLHFRCRTLCCEMQISSPADLLRYKFKSQKESIPIDMAPKQRRQMRGECRSPNCKPCFFPWCRSESLFSIMAQEMCQIYHIAAHAWVHDWSIRRGKFTFSPNDAIWGAFLGWKAGERECVCILFPVSRQAARRRRRP